jgi:3-mercaptopyruvate sulfurtransferase SseA
MLALLATMAGGYANPDQLVETDWVAAHAPASVAAIDIRIIDMRRAGYEQGHVLAISDATRVVVYDERGGIYAARLWWILNYFGHANVALMNGGWTTCRLPRRNPDRALHLLDVVASTFQHLQ